MKGQYDAQVGEKPQLLSEAHAQQKAVSPPMEWSPTKPYPKHNVYYPCTEALKPNEMRVITCGTDADIAIHDCMLTIPNARDRGSSSD